MPSSTVNTKYNLALLRYSKSYETYRHTADLVQHFNYKRLFFFFFLTKTGGFKICFTWSEWKNYSVTAYISIAREICVTDDNYFLQLHLQLNNVALRHFEYAGRERAG